jgi:hypothetical protein
LGARLLNWHRGAVVLTIIWGLAAAGCALAVQELDRRMSGIPQPISLEEAETIRYWFSQVGPDDCVLATYEVTAPLSSRRCLFSYILDQNKPKGFPLLDPAFHWGFVRKKDFAPEVFLDQGFKIACKGDFLVIFRR